MTERKAECKVCGDTERFADADALASSDWGEVSPLATRTQDAWKHLGYCPDHATGVFV